MAKATMAASDTGVRSMTTGVLADLAEQPQVIVAALGVIGAGLVTRRVDLTRGGSRMLAAHLAVTAMKRVVSHRADADPRPPGVGGNDHLTDMMLAGAVGWLAEALVGAVFARVEPVVERAVRARLAA